MTTGDHTLIIEAAHQVEALQSYPRLVSLVDATAAQLPSSRPLGLAGRACLGGVAWFLCAVDEIAHADADALARAFVWPSYARARRPSAHLTPGNAFSDAVLCRSPGGVVVLLSPLERSHACARALDLLFETRGRRPSGSVIAPRPIGRVLRDFDDAVARQDITGAQTLLTEAWATGRLSLVSRSFLQARVLTAQGNWKAVVDHALRHRFPDLQLPRVVEEDLLQAIYWVYLRPRLERDDVVGAIAEFRQHVQPIFGDVFRDYRGLTRPGAREAWMIRLAALDRDWPVEMRDELHAHSASDEWAQLDHIAQHVRFVEPVSSEESAIALLAAREDAAAFSLARGASDLPPGTRAGILVQAAVRLDDPLRLHTAAEAVGELAGGGTVAAPTALVERVATYPRPGIVVDGWSSWLRAVFEQPDWPDALRVVDEHGDEWGEAVARGTDTLCDVLDVIEALAGEEALRIVLPQLVRVAIPGGVGRAEAVRARRRLLQALAYAISQDPASGIADLDALADILAALLEAGVSPEEFDRIASEIEDVWRRIGGPPRLARWVVDVLSIVTTYPCPSESRRTEMLGALLAPVCADALRATRHIHVEVWLEIKDLLEGSGLTELVPSEILETARAAGDDADDFVHLKDRNILLHTLVPGAAERAADFIRRVVPSSRIATDESHVGNAQLREKVRRADFIVIASRAAKHAATEFIRQESALPIAWSAGKGWSSLVEALRVGAAPL